VREQLDLNPITYQAQATASGRVGYIRFPIFTTKSPQLMQRAIQALEQQHVRGYILDLRGNPGGVFEASIDIASMWLGQRQLISRIEQRGQQERYTAKGQALTLKPLIILVDGQSASASEVLAAALQENNRAKLIGSQTFGKGVVQTLANLQDGSGVVVTIAQYYTPKGNNIHKVGITPDVVVNVPAAEQIQRDPSLILPSQSDRSYARALKELSQVIRSQP
jgi:carboxyl-terminal processing protease